MEILQTRTRFSLKIKSFGKSLHDEFSLMKLFLGMLSFSIKRILKLAGLYVYRKCKKILGFVLIFF